MIWSGERVSPDTTSPILLIPVTNVPSYVHRATEIAYADLRRIRADQTVVMSRSDPTAGRSRM